MLTAAVGISDIAAAGAQIVPDARDGFDCSNRSNPARIIESVPDWGRAHVSVRHSS